MPWFIFLLLLKLIIIQAFSNRFSIITFPNFELIVDELHDKHKEINSLLTLDKFINLYS